MWVAQRDEVLCDPGEEDDHERGQQPVPQQVQHLPLPEKMSKKSACGIEEYSEESSLEDSTTTGRKSLCATLHHNIWIHVGAAAVLCEL